MAVKSARRDKLCLVGCYKSAEENSMSTDREAQAWLGWMIDLDDDYRAQAHFTAKGNR